MNAKQLYIYAIDQATAVVVQVLPEQLKRVTPDAECNVRDLLQRMLDELDQTTVAVGGITVTTNKRDDAVLAWGSHMQRAERAVEASRKSMMVREDGEVERVSDYLWAASNDQLMHAWDLGQAIGVSVVFDETAAQSLYTRAMALRRRRADSRPYGPLVPVPVGANTQTKLLAAMGRSEDWLEAIPRMGLRK